MAIVTNGFPQGNQNFEIYIDVRYSQIPESNATRVYVDLGLYLTKSYGSQTYSSRGACIITGWQSETVHTGYDLRGHSVGDYVLLGSTYFTYTHNADGTIGGITISASVDCSSTGQGVGRVSTTIYPPKIPRASTVNTHDFTVYLSSATMTYHITSASSSFTHQVTVYLPNGNYVRSDWGDSCNGTKLFSYTFTESERNQILNSMPNLNTYRATTRIETRDGDGTSMGTSDSWLTITIDPVSTAPSFSDFLFYDTNPEVIELTGNNQHIVRGQSRLVAAISNANKAAPTTGTSITNYILSCGEASAEAAFSSAENVTIALPNATSGTINVAAVDARGNQTVVTKVALLIQYTPPVLTKASAQREGGIGSKTKLNLSGDFWNDNFRGETTGTYMNTVTGKYRYRQTNSSTWSDEESFEIEAKSGKLRYDDYINGNLIPASEGFSPSQSFEIEITVTDRLSSTTITTSIASGVPVLDLYRLDDVVGIAIGSTYNPEVGGGVQVAGAPLSQCKKDTGGYYLKFYNGTMIQFGRRSITTYDNGGYYFTLPQNFASDDWTLIVALSATAPGSDLTVNVQYVNAYGGCNLWFSKGAGTYENKSVEISFIAIGRWTEEQP